MSKKITQAAPAKATASTARAHAAHAAHAPKPEPVKLYRDDKARIFQFALGLLHKQIGDDMLDPRSELGGLIQACVKDFVLRHDARYPQADLRLMQRYKELVYGNQGVAVSVTDLWANWLERETRVEQYHHGNPMVALNHEATVKLAFERKLKSKWYAERALYEPVLAPYTAAMHRRHQHMPAVEGRDDAGAGAGVRIPLVGLPGSWLVARTYVSDGYHSRYQGGDYVLVRNQDKEESERVAAYAAAYQARIAAIKDHATLLLQMLARVDTWEQAVAELPVLDGMQPVLVVPPTPKAGKLVATALSPYNAEQIANMRRTLQGLALKPEHAIQPVAAE